MLGLGRRRLADQLRLRLVNRDRVARVEEVLDPVAAVGAHVVGDPLGGGHDPRHDLAVDGAQPLVVLEHVSVAEAVGDHQRLRDEAVAVHQVRVDRPGVEDQLVDPLLAALIAPVGVVELGAPARARVPRRQPVGGREVDLLGRDEVVDHLGHVEPELLGGDLPAALVDVLQIVERVAAHRTAASTSSLAKNCFSAGHSSRSSDSAREHEPLDVAGLLLVEQRQLVRPREAAGIDLEVADQRADPRQRLDQLQRALVVGGEVVAVGDVQHVDVPVGRGIAIALDLADHLERRGDLRAARLDPAEELLLGDLARLGRVRDEHDLGLVVAAAQELHAPVEEQPRHPLAVDVHRPRHVHRQEDHRAAARLWDVAIGQVAQVGLLDPAQRGVSALGVAQQVLAQRRLLVELRSLARDLVIDGARRLDLGLVLGLEPWQLELGEQHLLDVGHVEPDLVELLARLQPGFARPGALPPGPSTSPGWPSPWPTPC